MWIIHGQAGQPGPLVPRPAEEECGRQGPFPALGQAAGARLVPALHQLNINAAVSEHLLLGKSTIIIIKKCTKNL